MNNDFDSFKILIQQTISDSLHNKSYKNLGEHSNCSKCGIALTRDNYKKDRTIPWKCFNVNVVFYFE